MHTLVRFLGTVAAVVLTLSVVPGLYTNGSWLTIFLIALVWSVVTLVIRPILALLTLPLTILTFGLFAFVLNALLFWLVAAIVPGFSVGGFIPALLGAVVLSLLSWLIHKII